MKGFDALSVPLLQQSVTHSLHCTDKTSRKSSAPWYKDTSHHIAGPGGHTAGSCRLSYWCRPSSAESCERAWTTTYTKTLVITWPSGKLPFECQKIAKKLTFFSKKLPKIFIFFKIKLPWQFFWKNENFWKKCQVFGNFLTVKWQFSGGSDTHQSWKIF